MRVDPEVYDGFIRDCPSLERCFPALTVVGKGAEYCFFVAKQEVMIQCKWSSVVRSLCVYSVEVGMAGRSLPS